MYPLYISQPQEQVVENDEDQSSEGCDWCRPEVGRLPIRLIHNIPTSELHRKEADVEDYCRVKHSLGLHVHESLDVEAFAQLAYIV